MNEKKLTKSEISWILYDVANSSFILIVTATIPIYFRSLASNAGVENYATSLWGSVTSISVLILAILSPILGALADYQHMKKRIFSVFLVLGILAAVCFTFTTNWLTFLIFFVFARIGYATCNILYDAMLVDVTTDDRMDQVSTHGYAWGYIGSCIPFIIGIIIIFTKPFGISTTAATQISFLITIVWWMMMSIPLFKNVKQNYYLPSRKDFVSHSFLRLGNTFQKMKKEKALFYYIIGYFFYIDGVYTIISMATTYGGEVGINDTSMILALLLTQFVAFPCAIFSGKLASKFGAVKMIKIFIMMYMVICVFGFQLDKEWEFWVLAIAVGMCQGGIQALSRSTYGRMIPKDESSEYFGFFDIFGKFADFFGPLILALCSLFFKSSKYGVLALVFLFILGLYFLIKSEKLLDKGRYTNG